MSGAIAYCRQVLAVLARLSVFRGWSGPEAAKEVCERPLALNYLAQLQEYSLVLLRERRNTAATLYTGTLRRIR